MDNDGKQQEDYFSWEASYSKTFAVILNDDSDNIGDSINRFTAFQHRKLTRNLSLIPGLKRGLLRNFVLIVDASKAAADVDLFPTRFKWLLNATRKFAGDYFEQNPLCQLAIILTRDGLAEKLVDLTSTELFDTKALKTIFIDDFSQIDAILKDTNVEPQGDASFKNALDLSLSVFGAMPLHVSKEILAVQFGLSSCDAGDINETKKALINQKISVSFISFLGQIFYSESITKATGGSFDVVLNEDHFMTLLLQYVHPPPLLSGMQKSLGFMVQMAFPVKKSIGELSMCLCHKKVLEEGFECPRCNTLICQIPSDCPVCQLTLISSTHLSRSYHHLFPIPPFEIIENQFEITATRCFSCSIEFEREKTLILRVSCPSCKRQFCSPCDIFIHENLHNCPGCLVK